MLATALTLTGPTVDRIVGIHFHISTIGGLSSFVLSFLIIDLILASLLYLDYRNKKTKTLWTCLIIYITGQLLYYLLPTFDGWSAFMKYIMWPAP